MRTCRGRILKILSPAGIYENLSAADDDQFEGEIRQMEYSDLEPHVYEGGFKVWESTGDMMDYLENNSDRVQGTNLLELGCGSAMPAIFSVMLGAKTATIQDFNRSVIQCYTEKNILLNNCDPRRFTMVFCDWKSVPEMPQFKKKFYDLIISSETIYNTSDYPAFHAALDHCLSDQGVVWLAGKIFYFGVGGSYPDFLDYINLENKFVVTNMKTIDAPITRFFIEMRRKHL
ncbi:unnamed protein product [Caenorhabditis auriculariae]|uniref:protein-histidine N-methyltransferase n=1 Tax=Caenorhabditis auriculariae TaxID=2777116 RepID=A0A8S1GSR2_9PELO|nr:unnamed protein product [Caenorhabditis auriculariae]